MESNIVILILIIVLIILLVSNSIKAYTMEGYNSESEQENQPTSQSKLVLYNTQWCGHSQQFLPIWNNIKNSTNQIAFVECDCDKDRDQCINIRGYPSLVLFKSDGSQVPYPDTQPRTQELVMKFIQDNA